MAKSPAIASKCSFPFCLFRRWWCCICLVLPPKRVSALRVATVQIHFTLLQTALYARDDACCIYVASCGYMVDAKCNLRESRGKPFPNSVCTLYCFHSHTHKKCINSPTRFPSSIPTVWGCPDVIFTWSRKPTARQRIYAPPPTTIICVLSSSAEAFFRARAHKSHITQRTTHTYIHTSGLKYKNKNHS